jgi:hypothetical protein
MYSVTVWVGVFVTVGVMLGVEVHREVREGTGVRVGKGVLVGNCVIVGVAVLVFPSVALGRSVTWGVYVCVLVISPGTPIDGNPLPESIVYPAMPAVRRINIPRIPPVKYTTRRSRLSGFRGGLATFGLLGSALLSTTAWGFWGWITEE